MQNNQMRKKLLLFPVNHRNLKQAGYIVIHFVKNIIE